MKNTPFSKRLSDENLEEIRKLLAKGDATQKDIRVIIQDMAYHHCHLADIGTMVSMTRVDLEDKYRDLLNQAQAMFRHDLRRAQVTNAISNKGSSAMLIWLGKQHLEQSDSPTLEIKKEQFDTFMEWIAAQPKPSSPPVPSK